MSRAYLAANRSVDAHGRSIITPMVDTDVLIAGAGPIGLTAAIELARRGVDIRVVDPIYDPPQYAKAVGVQPRTLEVFEGMGVLRRILDAAIQMKGQIRLRQRREDRRARNDHRPPICRSASSRSRSTPPSGSCARNWLCTACRSNAGLRVDSFQQDDDGVTATLVGDGGQQIAAGGLSRRRRRRSQHRPQGAGPDISRARRSRSSTCSATSRWTGRCRGLRHPVDAPDRRQDRRRAGLHSVAGPTGATACRCWCPTS